GARGDSAAGRDGWRASRRDRAALRFHAGSSRKPASATWWPLRHHGEFTAAGSGVAGGARPGGGGSGACAGGKGKCVAGRGGVTVDPLDLMIVQMSGPEPVFDEVTHAFLCNSRDELLERCRRGGLIEPVSLGRDAPWLWRLNFGTR